MMRLTSLLRLRDTSRASLYTIMSPHRRLSAGAPFVLPATRTAHLVISVCSVIFAAFGAFIVVDFFGAHGISLLCFYQFVFGR